MGPVRQRPAPTSDDVAVSRSRVLDVAAAASIVAVVCMFLGWGQSGRSVRSSFGLFQAAGRAGLLPDSVERLGLLLFFVPALAGAGLLAHAVERRRLAAVLYLIVGVAASTGSLLVVLSPLSVRSPAIIAGAAGVVAIFAVMLALTGRPDRGVT